MNYMFYDCSKLKSLDVSSFVVSDETAMAYAFSRCDRLKEITVSDRWKRTVGMPDISIVRKELAKRHRDARREGRER